MQRELHVRFGGRAGETHRPRGGRALRSDPYTYVRTWSGWLYLAVVIDVFSRKVVGWSMADHLRAELVIDALDMAVWNRRPETDVVHHSDRGCQYTSLAFGRRCRENGIAGIAGLVGTLFSAGSQYVSTGRIDVRKAVMTGLSTAAGVLVMPFGGPVAGAAVSSFGTSFSNELVDARDGRRSMNWGRVFVQGTLGTAVGGSFGQVRHVMAGSPWSAGVIANLKNDVNGLHQVVTACVTSTLGTLVSLVSGMPFEVAEQGI